MLFFTITDILLNQDGSFSNKGERIVNYVAIQAVEIFIGIISAKDAAAFVTAFIINFLYLELLSTMIQALLAKRGQ